MKRKWSALVFIIGLLGLAGGLYQNCADVKFAEQALLSQSCEQAQTSTPYIVQRFDEPNSFRWILFENTSQDRVAQNLIISPRTVSWTVDRAVIPNVTDATLELPTAQFPNRCEPYYITATVEVCGTLIEKENLLHIPQAGCSTTTTTSTSSTTTTTFPQDEFYLTAIGDDPPGIIISEGNDRVCGRGAPGERYGFYGVGGFVTGAYYLIEITQGTQFKCRENFYKPVDGPRWSMGMDCDSPFDPSMEAHANYWKSDRNGTKGIPALSNPFVFRIVPCP